MQRMSSSSGGSRSLSSTEKARPPKYICRGQPIRTEEEAIAHIERELMREAARRGEFWQPPGKR